jgi:hypothetical protein
MVRSTVSPGRSARPEVFFPTVRQASDLVLEFFTANRKAIRGPRRSLRDEGDLAPLVPLQC